MEGAAHAATSNHLEIHRGTKDFSRNPVFLFFFGINGCGKSRYHLMIVYLPDQSVRVLLAKVPTGV